MKRSEIKVLLVEDDNSLGKSLSEGLSRLGYTVKWASSSDQALSLFRVSTFDVVILDCLLPKKNGVELALEMRNFSGHDFKIILASGIFKDKSFIQDAIGQTKAVAFLSKPFDFNELKTHLENCIPQNIEEEKAPLTELLMHEVSNLKDVREVIEKSPMIHGYELPLVYSLLSHVGYTGQLNVLPAEKEMATVIFSKGQIVDVLLKDSQSYFGVLLVEMGFTSPEEVEESLASQGGKPIGQLLIDASALSPHAVAIVRIEQMAIRLSKSIQDTNVQISLAEFNGEFKDNGINPGQFSIALHDWVSSKISREWLINFYSQWLEHPLKITHNLDRITKVKDFPLLSAKSNILALINGQISLQSLIDRQIEAEYEILQAIHYGILERIFYFTAKPRTVSDFRSQMHRLNRLSSSLSNKNYFEQLGIRVEASSKDISKAYQELAKTYHPDKVDPQAPAAFKMLNNQVFATMTAAYDFLKDEAKRENYVKELKHGSASEAIESENQLDRSRRMLSLGQYKQAAENLSGLLEAKHNHGQIRIHYIWARLKYLQKKGHTSEKEKQHLESLMGQIPPEDRHCSAYFYAKGLMSRSYGDSEKAYTHFRNAVAIDPGMADARRDLLILTKEKESNAEWSNKVSKFFGGATKTNTSTRSTRKRRNT